MMKYMITWKEFDKGLNRDIEWQTYFEKQSEAIKFAEDQQKKGFTGITMKFL